MRPRILLVGYIGQVGWELQRTLATIGDVTAVDRPTIELSNADSIRDVIRASDPHIIINAAAYTAVDKAEEEPELARKINAIAPAIMAGEAKQLNALFVTYSTDYVFDGTKQEPWTEVDKPNPLSVYGRTKAEADAAVEACGGAYLIFRTSWVYGARGKNFLLTMMKLLRERDSLKVVDDQRGAPTWSRSIAEATAQIIAQKPWPKAAAQTGAARFTDVAGIYNFTCGGETTWYGFTEEIRKHLAACSTQPLARLIPIQSDEYPTAAKRPLNSVLDNRKLLENFCISLPEWSKALDLVMEELCAAESDSSRANIPVSDSLSSHR